LPRRATTTRFRFFLDALRGGGYSDRIRSRFEASGTMPVILEGDQELIEEPLDYLGLNVYSRVVVDSTKNDGHDSRRATPFPGGNFLDNGQEYYPRAVFDALELLRADYGWTGPVHITENGMSDGRSAEANPLEDDERITYVSGFLSGSRRLSVPVTTCVDITSGR
jgi:beta-glucosidase